MQMHRTFSFVSGASLGAGLMYFLDPDRRRRRRALMRDKSVRWSRKTRQFVDNASPDMQNRTKGMGSNAQSWMQPTPPVSDRIFAERVRSKLDQFSRRPSAIDVHATDGVVTLSGPVLEDEFDSISHAVARVPGVTQIFNRLEQHESPEEVPALQGSTERKPSPSVAFMQSNWSPTARMAAALMGTAALLYGLSQRTVGAATLVVSGLGLLVRSGTNQEFARLLNLKELEHV